MDSENMVSRGMSNRNSSQTEIDLKRRSLAKVGLSAPVLMTLASRPALAKQCSPSVMASGNLSNPVDTTTCGACNTNQWLNARLKDYQDCGIQDPTMFKVDQFFAIPMINTLFGSLPIISGNCVDALKGSCQIPYSLKFVDNQNNPVFRSTGQQILGDMVCNAVTLILNRLNPYTSMNISTYAVTDITTAVENVMVIAKNKINADQLLSVGQSLGLLMSDGSSCALT